MNIIRHSNPPTATFGIYFVSVVDPNLSIDQAIQLRSLATILARCNRYFEKSCTFIHFSSVIGLMHVETYKPFFGDSGSHLYVYSHNYSTDPHFL